MKLGIVGATGRVGREVLRRIEERRWVIDELRLFASSASEGRTVDALGRKHLVQQLTPDRLTGLDLLISSTPDEVAGQILPMASAAGVTVIDESARWREDPEIPLVIPEVNGHLIRADQRLFASPNCAVTQLAMTLAPVQRAFGLRRVVVTTLQSASGAGTRGEAELLDHSRQCLDAEPTTPRAFAEELAFNVLPQIGRLDSEWHSSEEIKIIQELRRLLGDSTLEVAVQTVRVPVVIGHGASVWLECEAHITHAEIAACLLQADGVEFFAPNQGLPTPRRAAGQDAVQVGRLRSGGRDQRHWQLFCAADNLRKGAATNAVQIAELWWQRATGRHPMDGTPAGSYVAGSAASPRIVPRH